jgi:hypothetical protein
MKELNSTEYIKAGDYMRVIAERRQKLSWYADYSIKLYDTGRKKDRYILDITCPDEYQYSYDDEDVSNPQKAVDEAVNKWINNRKNIPIEQYLERYDWGLIDRFDEVAEDYVGECVIVWIGNCHGYTPIGYIKNYSDADPQVFSSVEEAQKYIDVITNKKKYSLIYKEMRCPKYYIIANPH